MHILRKKVRAGAGIASACLAYAAGGAALAATAQSEAPTPAPAQAPNAAAVDSLQQVVVVARKRSESILSVPISVQAMSAADLEKRDIGDLRQLGDFTPNFRIEGSSVNRNDRGFNTFVVRGMYPSSDSPDRQTASLFMDGVPLGGGGSIPGLTDISQVEIVNGPQSAYFGRSTFAGAVNFITRPPSFTPSASGEATIAGYGEQEYKVTVEGPIVNDVLSARLSGRYYKTDGDYDNYGYGGRLGSQSTKSVGLSLNYEPNSRLHVRTFLTAWEDNDGSPAQSVLTASSYNCNPAGGAVKDYTCGGISSVPSNTMVQNNTNTGFVLPKLTAIDDPLNPDFIQHYGLRRVESLGHILADYDLGGGYTLSANAGYVRDEWGLLTDTTNQYLINSPNPSYTPAKAGLLLPYRSTTALLGYIITDKTAEVKISSPKNDRFQWTLGSNYYGQRTTTFTSVFVNTGFISATFPVIYATDTTGFFGSGQYDFGYGVKASFEARYQLDRIGQHVLSAGGTDLSHVYKSFTPRAILQWQFAPNEMAYISYSRGDRPGEFNGAFYSRPTSVQQQINASSGLNVSVSVPEETMDMAELGVKGDFFEHKLRLLADVYYGDWQGKHTQQSVTYTDPTTGGLTGFQVVSANGNVIVEGVEIQSTYIPTRGLQIDGTFGYAGTIIQRDYCAECLVIDGKSDEVGNRLPRYPAFTGSLGVSYERRVFADYNGYGRVDYIYTGKQYADESNTAWTDASNRVNLRFGIDNGRYKLEIFGENIFDDKTPISIQRSTDPITNGNTLVVSPPLRATVGLRVGAHF